MTTAVEAIAFVQFSLLDNGHIIFSVLPRVRNEIMVATFYCGTLSTFPMCVNRGNNEKPARCVHIPANHAKGAVRYSNVE